MNLKICILPHVIGHKYNISIKHIYLQLILFFLTIIDAYEVSLKLRASLQSFTNICIKHPT